MREAAIDSGGCSAGTVGVRSISQMLPVANATQPYWRTQLHPIDEHRSTAKLPEECDIAIIGAGFSGVATAYHLSRLAGKDKPSIVMLEARQVCSGATGRNGGHAKVKIDSVQNMIRSRGVEDAEEFVTFSLDHIQALKHVVETEGLDCEFEVRRTYDVFLDKGEADEMRQQFKASVKRGQQWTKEADCIDDRYVEQVTSLEGAKVAFSSPVCSLWPYKFVSQLLARLLETEDLNLQTNTPVTRVEQDEATDRNTLHTSRGSLKARKVVFATNAYTAGICSVYTGTIVPYKGTASHITPMNGPVSPHLSNTYNISFPPGPGMTDYLNPRPDGSIVVGGGKWTYVEDRDRWWNTWDDSTQLSEALPHFQSLMQTYFRGWEESGAKVDAIWTGVQGETTDGLQHVGPVPGSDGRQYVIAGFNGGGNGLVFNSALGLAKMVLGASYEESGLPKMFKTTQERLDLASV